MKRIRPVPEPGVIAEFLKNEFYHGEFHRDRDRFEQLVMKADINNERDNALRRALLFRRRGHMWRELPADTQWWQIEFETEDLELIRVFPRAQWRRVSRGNYQLTDIARRIKSEKFAGKTGDFIAKVQALSYRMRTQHNNSSVLLIGIDESHPFTILEGNHRLTAAMLVSPEIVRSRFQVFCGLSPNMARSCWYETNFANLWRYAQNRFRNLMYDREADVNRVMKTSAPVSTGETALDASVGVGKAFPGSK